LGKYTEKGGRRPGNVPAGLPGSGGVKSDYKNMAWPVAFCSQIRVEKFEEGGGGGVYRSMASEEDRGGVKE